MTRIIVRLRQIAPNRWQLESTKEIAVSSVFLGDETQALEWAKCFCSSWQNWVLEYKGLQKGINYVSRPY